jgi:hypothetical protein
LNTNIIIEKLNIKADFPTTIEENAFNSTNFQNISDLILQDNIVQLKADCFVGLHRLDTLDIMINGNSLVSVAAGILNAVPNLSTLQITSRIKDDILNNFLHGTNMNNLLTLSINNNNLQELKSDILNGMTNMQALHAMSSGLMRVESSILASSASSIQTISFGDNKLETLPVDIFDISSYRESFQVSLHKNKLKTLPKGIFDKAIERSKNVKVTLADNDWHCDCDLAWLQQLISNKTIYLIDETNKATCESPEINKGISLEDADFSACTTTTVSSTTLSSTPSTVTTTTDSTTSSEMETTTTDSTTSSTVETTTTKLSTPTTVETTTGSSSSISTTDTVTNDVTTVSTTDSTGTYQDVNCTCTTCITDRIHILAKKDSEEPSFASFNSIKSFEIVEDDQNKKLKVKIQANNEHVLIWMNTDDTNNIHCNYTYFMREKRDSLNMFSAEFKTKPHTSYTMCAISQEVTISPLNCRAYTTLPSEGHRPWLLNNQESMIWAIFCSAVAVSLIIGGIIIYTAVRHNPRLIKGNKRVIVVGHRAGEVIVMPKECSMANTGFRRMSDTSYYTARTSKTSYVTAIQPTAVQLIAWKFNRMWDRLVEKRENEYANKSNPKEPPPLPPYPKDISLQSSHEINFPHDCNSCYTTVV